MRQPGDDLTLKPRRGLFRPVLHTFTNRIRRFAASRRRPLPPEALIELALPAGRARAMAEATLAFLLGFALDDLRALRFPGFLLGAAAAILLLSFRGTAYAKSLASEGESVSRDLAERRIRHAITIHRLYALASVLLFVSYLVATSQGVNLFPA
jgi:hypothetical protein